MESFMIFVLWFITGIGSFLIGFGVCTNIYQSQAIERGFARFNETIGNWEWK